MRQDKELQLRQNTQEEDFPELPEGSRAPQYDYIYKGGFVDRASHIKAVNLAFV
jgi:hypothetical protein